MVSTTGLVRLGLLGTDDRPEGVELDCRRRPDGLAPPPRRVAGGAGAVGVGRPGGGRAGAGRRRDHRCHRRHPRPRSGAAGVLRQARTDGTLPQELVLLGVDERRRRGLGPGRAGQAAGRRGARARSRGPQPTAIRQHHARRTAGGHPRRHPGRERGRGDGPRRCRHRSPATASSTARCCRPTSTRCCAVRRHHRRGPAVARRRAGRPPPPGGRPRRPPVPAPPRLAPRRRCAGGRGQRRAGDDGRPVGGDRGGLAPHDPVRRRRRPRRGGGSARPRSAGTWRTRSIPAARRDGSCPVRRPTSASSTSPSPQMLDEPDATRVRHTVVAGRLVHP